MKAVLVLALVAATSQAAFLEVKEDWTQFKLTHNRNYATEMEEEFRMNIFEENRRKVELHNARLGGALTGSRLALNHLADRLPIEIERLNGFKRLNATKLVRSTFIAPVNVEIPEEVDWRKKGAVTGIRHQGDCGSCWAFSANGALEGQNFRKTGQLVSLSEQNLIDCSSKYGNHGCDGGDTEAAYQYIKNNGGIDTETSYPYEAQDDVCRFNRNNVGAVDSGFMELKEGDENQLKEAVATMGPVAVAIDASFRSFHFHSSGVYYEPDCSSYDLSHAVLVVGYGTTAQGEKYWIVKNSWGDRWGEGGYVRMARDKDNNCGIASYATIPLV